MTVRAIVVGASGYTGMELVKILKRHCEISLEALYVSKGSADAMKNIDSLYGQLQGICSLPLEPLDDVLEAAQKADVVFLATEHKVSHDLAPVFYENGCVVFDLSGAFRVKDPEFYTKYYGFEHEHEELLNKAVYALCEYTDILDLQNGRMISMPGCYPTACQLSLKPLLEADVIDKSYRPSLNAISGVTGAGRKATLNNSFCEVSLNAYNLFVHRHQPEIATHLGTDVIFNAHLGPFKRGIHATVTAKLNKKLSRDEIEAIYKDAYRHSPLVRIKDNLPKLADVVDSAFCDIGFALDDKGYIVICSVIDNLLKGAAAQAVQALNLHYGFDETLGLV